VIQFMIENQGLAQACILGVVILAAVAFNELT